MLEKIDKSYLFLTDKDLNKAVVNDRYKHHSKSVWVFFLTEPVVYKIKGVCAFERMARVLGMPENDFKALMLGYFIKCKAVVGVEGKDCVVAHPRAFGEILSRVYPNLIRKSIATR